MPSVTPTPAPVNPVAQRLAQTIQQRRHKEKMKTLQSGLDGMGKLAADKAEIAALVHKLFAARDTAHALHLKLKGLPKHEALNAFYDELLPQIDNFVETCQGQYGILEPAKSLKIDGDAEPVPFLQGVADAIHTGRGKFGPQDSHLQNLLDEMLALTYKTIYKLEQLDCKTAGDRYALLGRHAARLQSGMDKEAGLWDVVKAPFKWAGNAISRAGKGIVGGVTAGLGGLGYLGGKAVQGVGNLFGANQNGAFMQGTKAWNDSMGRSALAGLKDVGGAVNPWEAAGNSHVANNMNQQFQQSNASGGLRLAGNLANGAANMAAQGLTGAGAARAGGALLQSANRAGQATGQALQTTNTLGNMNRNLDMITESQGPWYARLPQMALGAYGLKAPLQQAGAKALGAAAAPLPGMQSYDLHKAGGDMAYELSPFARSFVLRLSKSGFGREQIKRACDYAGRHYGEKVAAELEKAALGLGEAVGFLRKGWQAASAGKQLADRALPGAQQMMNIGSGAQKAWNYAGRPLAHAAMGAMTGSAVAPEGHGGLGAVTGGLAGLAGGTPWGQAFLKANPALHASYRNSALGGTAGQAVDSLAGAAGIDTGGAGARWGARGGLLSGLADKFMPGAGKSVTQGFQDFSSGANPTGWFSAPKNLAAKAGKYVGLGTVGLGAGGMIMQNKLEAKMPEIMENQVRQMTGGKMGTQELGAMLQQASGNPMGGMLGHLNSFADTILGAMGLPVQNMAPWQKAMILMGGTAAIGGALSGHNGVAGLGGLGALAGVAPLLMGRGGQPGVASPTVANQPGTQPAKPSTDPQWWQRANPQRHVLAQLPGMDQQAFGGAL